LRLGDCVIYDHKTLAWQKPVTAKTRIEAMSANPYRAVFVGRYRNTLHVLATSEWAIRVPRIPRRSIAPPHQPFHIAHALDDFPEGLALARPYRDPWFRR
jgi:hypothetical protein